MTALDHAATRNEIIERALRNIGVIGENQNGTAYQIDKGSKALNGIVKSFGLNNTFGWRQTPTTFNTVASTTSYTPAEGVIGLTQAFVRIDSNDYPMNNVAYDTYYGLQRLKSAEARPTEIVFKSNPTAALIYLHPTPDAVYAVHYLATMKCKDYDAASDVNLFPSHWEEVLVWKLSAALSHEYGLPMQERMALEAKAQKMYEDSRLDNWQHFGRGEITFESA